LWKFCPRPTNFIINEKQHEIIRNSQANDLKKALDEIDKIVWYLNYIILLETRIQVKEKRRERRIKEQKRKIFEEEMEKIRRKTEKERKKLKYSNDLYILFSTRFF
jgi:hypothetical protein